MDILHEIIETADNIMSELQETDFFEKYMFCDPFKLRRELEIQMQRNWEQLDDMYLNDEQFEEVIKRVTEEGINKTFAEMVMNGTMIMDSVNSDGELVYKLNPKVNINDLQSK
jgi:hypothetical protein